MRYFFIDYENVRWDGLTGLDKLTESDCVIIYYSEDAQTLTFGLHRRIEQSSAEFQYVKVLDRIKNALDCKIIFDLRTFIKTDKYADYYIVSQDKDYDDPISQWQERGIRIIKISTISQYRNVSFPTKHTRMPVHQSIANLQKNAPSKREQIVRSFFGKHLKDYSDHKEDIVQIILECSTRQEINNELQKYYYNNGVKDILQIIKPLIADYPGR